MLRRLGCAALAATLALSLLAVAGNAQTETPAIVQPTFVPGGNPDLAKYKVVFTVIDRNVPGAFQSIYTARGDGSNIGHLNPLGDNVFYDWPVWAFNGTHIIFSARRQAESGGEENLYMMRADGTDPRQLTFTSWRNGQPKLSPDGRSVIFNSNWSEFAPAGIFRLHLDTGEVQAVSASQSAAIHDADPRWAADGQSLMVASLGLQKDDVERPNQIYRLDPNGEHRERITNTPWYDTDPAPSPDGTAVAISSYRGGGPPGKTAQTKDLIGYTDVAFGDWFLILHDLATSQDTPLTRGKNCLRQLPPDICSASEGPAWVPIWVDLQHIAFLSARSALAMGIYMIGRDGSNAQPVIEALGRAVDWHDWTLADQPLPEPSLLSEINVGPLPPALLYVAPDPGDTDPTGRPPAARLYKATADHWLNTPLDPRTADGRPLVPEVARFTRDKQSIIFSARLPDDTVPASNAPAELDPTAARPSQTQIFMMSAAGGPARQLTTPTTEDVLEPIPDDVPRSNSDPDITPDGRFVVFVNHSDAQTWIMRLDMQTGEVLNLTSMNRGILPGVDAQPRISPDGRRIAFVANLGFTLQVFTLSIDGDDTRQVTDTLLQPFDPSWSPDGRSLVFATLLPRSAPPGVGLLPDANWSLSRLDLATGVQRTLIAGDRPLLGPTWSPDGSKIAYIGIGPTDQPDIYLMTAEGGNPHPLVVTLRTRETFFDWR